MNFPELRTVSSVRFEETLDNKFQACFGCGTVVHEDEDCGCFEAGESLT